MAGDGTAHWLKPAQPASAPAAVIALDSETASREVDGVEVHQLRLWRARLTRRRDRRHPGETETAGGVTGEQAAEVIDRWATSARSAWLYAHNVSFDLVVTQLAGQLAGLGWELSAKFGVSKGSMWCVLHKGRRERPDPRGRRADGRPGVKVDWDATLTIADSASIWPAPLADLAGLVGMVKPPLPDGDDSDEAWSVRCQADVDILMCLLLSLMDWWESARMGRWSVSGAGLGWQTMRRMLGWRQAVIDHDPAITAFERQAVYGGRRDVFQVGELPPGRYSEWDFTAAYPNIAANFPMPAKVACPVDDRHRAQALAGRVPHGMIAEVELDAMEARWPARIGGRVFYPVGRFRTTLAAPDIQAAADAGALVAVYDGLIYTMTGYLRDWARQVLRWADPDASQEPGPVRAAAKNWSRAVIGKFAERGYSTRRWVGEPCEDWAVQETVDLYTGTRGMLVGLGGCWWLSWADQQGEHERPAVLAFVESHVRVRLGQLVTGPLRGAVMQCDTDGMLVSHMRLSQLAAGMGVKWLRGRQVPKDAGDLLAVCADVAHPLTLREKAAYARARIIGPQHMVLDGRPVLAGVPRSAWQAGSNRWAARLWPGIIWQSQHGPPKGYGRPVMAYVMAGPYAAGWVLATGQVAPVEVGVDADGRQVVSGWNQTRWARMGHVLDGAQPSWADGLWEAQHAEIAASDQTG